VTRRHRGLLAAALGAVALLVASCSDGGTVEAFCEQVEATVDAGPLFPDRTDGEPVPSAEGLEAIEELADAAPDEISDAVDVLVAEAEALVAEAADRVTTTTGGDAADDGGADEPDPADADGARPARADVEAAQAEVIAFIDRECEVDLGR
jgi:hypothetical protein